MYSLCFFQLEVFQPFFISPNLPNSVIRGEEFALEIAIFNYLKVATEVMYERFCSPLILQEEMEKTCRAWFG